MADLAAVDVGRAAADVDPAAKAVAADAAVAEAIAKAAAGATTGAAAGKTAAARPTESFRK